MPRPRVPNVTNAPDQGPTDDTIAAAFAAYDPAGMGNIPVDCLTNLMADLGLSLAPEQARRAATQLDRAGLGSVTYGEFMLWWKG